MEKKERQPNHSKTPSLPKETSSLVSEKQIGFRKGGGRELGKGGNGRSETERGEEMNGR